MRFYVPKEMATNAALGLYLSDKYGRGGTEVGRRMARRIIKAYRMNNGLTLETMLRINRYFPRHASDNLEQKDPPSNGYIAWNLWGGYYGWDYTQRLRSLHGV